MDRGGDRKMTQLRTLGGYFVGIRVHLLFIRGSTFDRRADLGVAEIEAGGFEISLAWATLAPASAISASSTANCWRAAASPAWADLVTDCASSSAAEARSAFCRVPKVVAARLR